MDVPTVGQGSIVCMTSFNHVDAGPSGSTRLSFTADRGQKFAFLMLGAVKKDYTVTEKNLQAVMVKFGYLVPDDVQRWSKRIDYLQHCLKEAGVDFLSEEDWLEEGRKEIEAEKAKAVGAK